MRNFRDGWFLSNHLSYQHPSFFFQISEIWIIFHLIFYHQLWMISIFRLEALLSFMHQNTIKLRLQRCWWKLELILSWEIIKWSLSSGSFHFLFMFVGSNSKRLCKKKGFFWSWKIIGEIWGRFWRIERFEMNLVNICENRRRWRSDEEMGRVI